MSDENHKPEQTDGPIEESRSVESVVQVIGIAAGGFGTLGLGASKVKETFFGGQKNEAAPPAASPPTTPNEPK
jgi:hypothetical protein